MHLGAGPLPQSRHVAPLRQPRMDKTVESAYKQQREPGRKHWEEDEEEE